ncbi:dipeptide ABC transporter ATP-binding protein [Sciscionella marina]|uniref:dipeptide ABC transporter ATP-binding protein n=1 Tax=Sciscionella marina TaxID=508770 RepID=UPI000360F9AF|nr:ABC transporter ATP-binding protein [Sciscionella marina]
MSTSTEAETERPAHDGQSAVLRVEDLCVGFDLPREGHREVVHGASFSLERGRCLAIVGESGSGKSVLARTLVGLTGAHATVAARRFELLGKDLRGLDEAEWRRIRGEEVGFVLQDALVSLDPLRTAGREIDEVLRTHRYGRGPVRRARALDVLARVGVPDPELLVRQLPHQLSGGLRQRALIASAIALDPALIIADEPTTALDVTVQATILDLLGELQSAGSSVLLVSHDLAVVDRIADEVAVVKGGHIVEFGATEKILRAPEHDYTRRLLDAIPSANSRGRRLSPGAASVAVRTPSATETVPLLEARDLVKSFHDPEVGRRTVVRDVSFTIARGETLGLVGESGSGKTTSARIALALERPDSGEVLLEGEPWSAATARERRARRSAISVVYQDPLSSFDPRWDGLRIVADAVPMRVFRTRAGRRRRASELLDRVGLPADTHTNPPLRLSGGQRQRIAIARALASDPKTIVLDEPVSALDVSIQAQVLDLLADLQQDFGVSYLFISHDLGVVHHVSDRVAVMQGGHIVEQGEADEIFLRPEHPYTRQLIGALPRLEQEVLR